MITVEGFDEDHEGDHDAMRKIMTATTTKIMKETTLKRRR
jgi:hypothetical protein